VGVVGSRSQMLGEASQVVRQQSSLVAHRLFWGLPPFRSRRDTHRRLHTSPAPLPHAAANPAKLNLKSCQTARFGAKDLLLNAKIGSIMWEIVGISGAFGR
jgi:hypothetical protein